MLGRPGSGLVRGKAHSAQPPNQTDQPTKHAKSSRRNAPILGTKFQLWPVIHESGVAVKTPTRLCSQSPRSAARATHVSTATAAATLIHCIATCQLDCDCDRLIYYYKCSLRQKTNFSLQLFPANTTNHPQNDDVDATSNLV